MSVDNRYDLEVGSMVEVTRMEGVPRYGVIRWMGNIPQVKGRLVAGLELVSEIYQTVNDTFDFFSSLLLIIVSPTFIYTFFL